MNTSCASRRSFIIGRRSNSQRMNRSTLTILTIYFLLMLIFVSTDISMQCRALETDIKTDNKAETITVDSSTVASSSTITADKNTQPQVSSTTPTPTAILETEARTARELSIAVHNLHKDLKSCKTRINSINSGFQNLYSMHLAQIDGLRKCKEGMITSSDLQKIFDRNESLSKVDTTKALMEEAEAALIEQKRTLQNEEIASKHKELIRNLEDQIHQLRLREDAWERTISELVARNDMLERRETAWKKTIADLMTNIEIRNNREWWWEQMMSEMEGRIAGLSYHAILDRFGPGPHRISMVVEYDGNEREIIIELAPIDLMPHSIHIFLSQISLGYWTRGNPAIVMNPGHVLQACPHPCLENKAMGGSYAGDPYEEMRQEGLDSVSFQEYHPDYPHEKYTIGFAGRPHGGPEFYINMMDNTLDHGPKKAMVDDDEDADDEVDETAMEPDPCFGRIISGFEVVDKIAEEGVRRADLPDDAKENIDVDDNMELSDSLLLQPIRIVAMNILEVDDSSSPNDSRDEL